MSQLQSVILSAVGRDRTGIVRAVSRVLFESGCNIEDSSMSILAGEFAMILVISLPKGKSTAQLDRSFNKVRKELGLSIFLKSFHVKVKSRALKSKSTHMVSVYGVDQPGIVYRVSDILAKKKINITDVNTRRIAQKNSYVYMMMLEVECPPAFAFETVKQSLEVLSKKLNVTITSHPVETLTL